MSYLMGKPLAVAFANTVCGIPDLAIAAKISLRGIRKEKVRRYYVKHLVDFCTTIAQVPVARWSVLHHRVRQELAPAWEQWE